ncbi:MAG: antitoxin VapB family protein, partial [Archaeoglobales archaeon]|nr:antitoxin VapB family protein [Archaeoglobales archaeon]
MAKTIALSDEVYEMLSKAKMKGESFSDAIRRLLERQ